ncbi:hypothetical protein DFH28DRAFT_881182 [Melampsora americana]|nr:hypothetical protein DFH28DRAFT_881182 [Melampsora americana]
MTLIPSPQAGTGYPTQTHAMLYIQEHANDHGYCATINDSRTKWVQWKCYLGPTRHKDPNLKTISKTCPFLVTSKRDSSNGTWYFTIQHGTHNHDAKYTVPKHDLSILRKTIEKEDEKALQEVEERRCKLQNNLTPQISSFTPHTTPPITQTPLSSNIISLVTLQYQSLQHQMKALPIESQSFLLSRFLSECQLASGLASTTSSQHPPVAPKPPPLLDTTPHTSTSSEVVSQVVSLLI